MKSQRNVWRSRSGAALIVVMGLSALIVIASTAIAISINGRVRLAFKQIDLEQAFYVASGGAERAASYVAGGNDASTTLSGSIGVGRYVATVVSVSGSGEVRFDVTSVGTVNGISRTVTIHGLRRVSWARYALWYDQEATKLWIAPGERFDGRVYSKPQLHFHNKDLATKGQVRFTDKVWSVPTTIEKASSAVDPIFEQGITLGASEESMTSIDFSALKTTASSGGLVFDGATTIVLAGSTMKVTNSRAGYSNKSVAIPANGVVYVRTVTSGTTSTRTGNIVLSAPTGLSGQLTLVSDYDIQIVGHVKYANDPAVKPTSTDALGLVAKHAVEVQTSAPNDLQIYAHIICQDSGFGVDDYDVGSSRGTLTVYGGIVNRVRNAVGIVGGAGYSKNYIFDKRFATNPPPSYPKVTDELEWAEWEG